MSESQPHAHACFDRVPSPEEKERSLDIGFELNLVREIGQLEAAALNSALWRTGSTLTVAFLEGEESVKARVREKAMIWTQHANIGFDFVPGTEANIRISFGLPSSWSYLGTDALGIDAARPTMNFGWLKPETSDEEYSRVVLHEFGHALGMFHEHQNPAGGVQWDREAVTRSLSGAPNHWSLSQIETNMFKAYGKDVTQFTSFDPESIMLYAFPKEWTLDGMAFPSNHRLSPTDVAFIRSRYP